MPSLKELTPGIVQNSPSVVVVDLYFWCPMHILLPGLAMVQLTTVSPEQKQTEPLWHQGKHEFSKAPCVPAAIEFPCHPYTLNSALT